MDLNQFANIIATKQDELKATLREEAKKITLNDILSETRRYERDFSLGNPRFVRGEDLSYTLCQGWYEIQINEKRLALASSGFCLAQFEGKEVSNLYNELCESVLRSQKKEEYVPF